MSFILKTDKDVEDYFREWLDDINSQIKARNPAHTIENYPEIEKAFKMLKDAWLASFKEMEIMGRMRLRGAALVTLDKTLQRNLK
jgi:hypothetical protein